jgi:hypothetical protein
MSLAGTANATRVVRFLGLSDFASTTGDQASFPMGILYPYSRDLQRVCACCDALSQDSPDLSPILMGEMVRPVAGPGIEQTPGVTAFLGSIATLHGRIAFAPGPEPDAVNAAYRLANQALSPMAKHPRTR